MSTSKKQNSMFKQENAPELVYNYLKQGKRLRDEEVLEMFQLPNAGKCLEVLLEYRMLPPSLELAMLKMPNVKELLTVYSEYEALSDEVVLAMFQHPEAEELVRIYLKGGNELSGEVKKEWNKLRKMKK